MKEFLENRNQSLLDAYEKLPSLIREHAGIEQVVLAGGYGYRQVLELVQNGADAILEAQGDGQDGQEQANGNRIHVALNGSRLYVANTGAPLSVEGLEALLSSHSSPKRGNQIGRFGLGFKSLLRCGGRIDLFTRASGAIRFDPCRCREELKARFHVQEAPALRLAWSLEESDRAADEILAQLSWAETIVRVELETQDLLDHLQNEIRSFPAEFLLFFEVATRLTMDDGEHQPREMFVKKGGKDSLLHDGKGIAVWRVATRAGTVTDERALGDATHLHARDSVPITWAVPLEARRDESGRFWAFFPTHTPTYLPGILNAPWKLNSDRNSIIGGEWNTELMRQAAELVAETLPTLTSADDPGRLLDAFPRQLSRADEDAAPLVLNLWKTLEGAAVIPDATGMLRRGHELFSHPRESPKLARDWQAIAPPEALRTVVHPTCLERQRASRLNAFAERLKPPGGVQPFRPGLRKREPASWFAAVASAEVKKAIHALQLAEAYAADCKQGEWSEVRSLLPIIPSHDAHLLTANKVIFGAPGVIIPDREPVDPALCEDREAKRILAEILKVNELDDYAWEEALRNALPRGQRVYPDTSYGGKWRSFWAILRSAPLRVCMRFLEAFTHQIRVRRRKGDWVPSDDVILPGSLVNTTDTAENQALLVDAEVHGNDGRWLGIMGVKESPSGSIGIEARDLPDFPHVWLEWCRDRYKQTHRNRASTDYLMPFALTMPRGWGLLWWLRERPNTRLTLSFLDWMKQEKCVSRLKFGHRTQDHYPTIDIPHPLPWWLLRCGTVLVGDVAVRLSAVVARRREPSLGRLANWELLQSAFDKLEQVEPACPPTAVDVRQLWLALFGTFATPSALADDSLGELWSGAAKDEVVPETLRTEAAEVPLSRVFATGSADLARRARSADRVVITLDESALKLWLSKGAQDLSKLIMPAWAGVCGPADLLVSVVPELAEVLSAEAKATVRGQPVSELKLNIADASEPVPCLLWEDSLLLDMVQLSRITRAQRMELLVSEVAAAGWLNCDPAKALEHLGNAQVEERRAHVAGGNSLAEQLLRAVGGHEEPLRTALGNLAAMEFIQRCKSLQLAKLTLAQLGPSALSNLKVAMADEGLQPPSRWNSAEARAFVASIGFPEAFAASAESRREPEVFISGPIPLPSLHDFQGEVMEGIRNLVASGTARRRAVVSLPTGGGKTRVTVEAAVLLILKPEGEQRSVVWVAQTDELCEQAVQAFRQVWLNLGAQSTDLRIIRLWDRNPNPAGQECNKPVVVVASIQTLNSRMGVNGLAWLQKPGLVVVDECHHAITPSYTNLLRWLDAEPQRSGAPQKDEPAIIGLSATPFRKDDEESQRLARRFDNRWFPGDQHLLHARLLSQGVLARIEYDPLQSGTGLLPEEIARLSRLSEPWEGLDFDRILEAINQRLAGDEKRNRRLLERIQQATERSILFFTNSVFHAEEMSARLNLADIPAAAISGTTPTVARRYFLHRFQRGDVRVLCNHSVLATGFDAPRTDLVLIARQVFSPVRFMQMVGRGLRGEKNGGTARCRIVTVVDNLGRFQNRHPYDYCQRHFSGTASNRTAPPVQD